jgi:class 3 adenylate cyclase
LGYHTCATPGDERKLVTVLFADVAGSTELATRHDAEALRALLSAFFQEMRHRVEAFVPRPSPYAARPRPRVGA